ncbi:MAG: ribose-phosphate diphosphokinase [Candidatus Kerfeldbacteria bacterium]
MPAFDYGNLAVVGCGNDQLAADIARLLGVGLTYINIGSHDDGEPKVLEVDDLRGKHVIFVASEQQPDRNYINLCAKIMIAKRAAHRITVIITLQAYQRQDRREEPRRVVTLKIPIKLIAQSGADDVILVEPHSEVGVALYEAYNDGLRVDRLYTQAVLLDWLMTQDLTKAIITSIDLGGVKRVRAVCRSLRELGHRVEIGFADKDGTTSTGFHDEPIIMGNFDVDVAYGLDDLVTTGTSARIICNAAKGLGAKKFVLVITHPVFANDAVCYTLAESAIDGVVTMDTVPISNRHREILGPKLTVISAAPFIAVLVDHVYRDRGLSPLFRVDGYRAALQELGLR